MLDLLVKGLKESNEQNHTETLDSLTTEDEWRAYAQDYARRFLDDALWFVGDQLNHPEMARKLANALERRGMIPDDIKSDEDRIKFAQDLYHNDRYSLTNLIR